jgi:hypothetical protein
MLPFTPRMLSLVLDHVLVSRVSQPREHNRGVKGSMVSLRLLDHMFVSRVSQTRENKRGVKGTLTLDLTDSRRACYPL